MLRKPGGAALDDRIFPTLSCNRHQDRGGMDQAVMLLATIFIFIFFFPPFPPLFQKVSETRHMDTLHCRTWGCLSFKIFSGVMTSSLSLIGLFFAMLNMWLFEVVVLCCVCLKRSSRLTVVLCRS